MNVFLAAHLPGEAEGCLWVGWWRWEQEAALPLSGLLCFASR